MCRAKHVIWITGLSGAGKTTLAKTLAEWLLSAAIIDGDELRAGLCRDLGFEYRDRRENVRRAAEVAILMANAGMTPLVALISPSRDQRRMARELIEHAGFNFIEVYVATPLVVCERRDPKGLYAKARSREIPDFTGITSAYEAPLKPDVMVGQLSNDRDAVEVLTYLASLARQDRPKEF